MDLVYSSLNRALIKSVPELRLLYSQTVAEWDGEEPGPHIVFGDIVLPWFLDQLRDSSDSEALSRLLGFLEELADHPDIEVQNVLAHSIFEPGLACEPELHERARKRMGPALRRMSEEYL